jgi:hypothetical protein
MKLLMVSFFAFLAVVCVFASEPVKVIEMPEVVFSVKIPHHNAQVGFTSEVSAAEVFVDDSSGFKDKAESEASRLVKLCLSLGFFLVIIVSLYLFLFRRSLFLKNRKRVDSGKD